MPFILSLGLEFGPDRIEVVIGCIVSVSKRERVWVPMVDLSPAERVSRLRTGTQIRGPLRVGISPQGRKR